MERVTTQGLLVYPRLVWWLLNNTRHRANDLLVKSNIKLISLPVWFARKWMIGQGGKGGVGPQLALQPLPSLSGGPGSQAERRRHAGTRTCTLHSRRPVAHVHVQRREPAKGGFLLLLLLRPIDID